MEIIEIIFAQLVEQNLVAQAELTRIINDSQLEIREKAKSIGDLLTEMVLIEAKQNKLQSMIPKDDKTKGEILG